MATHRFRQFTPSLHYSQTQRNNLRCQQKLNDVSSVGFHERADDAETGEAQVFEGSRLADSVQERVQVQRDMR